MPSQVSVQVNTGSGMLLVCMQGQHFDVVLVQEEEEQGPQDHDHDVQCSSLQLHELPHDSRHFWSIAGLHEDAAFGEQSKGIACEATDTPCRNRVFHENEWGADEVKVTSRRRAARFS